MSHDMDTVTCPKCGGDTVRGVAEQYGECSGCMKKEYLGLTTYERRVYQALRARGLSREDARSEALDGVSLEDARRFVNSRLHGATAGRNLRMYDVLVDLTRRGGRVTRTVGEDITSGSILEVREDGRVYAAPRYLCPECTRGEHHACSEPGVCRCTINPDTGEDEA